MTERWEAVHVDSAIILSCCSQVKCKHELRGNHISAFCSVRDDVCLPFGLKEKTTFSVICETVHFMCFATLLKVSRRATTVKHLH